MCKRLVVKDVRAFSGFLAALAAAPRAENGFERDVQVIELVI
jgi:hypothetical protein